MMRVSTSPSSSPSRRKPISKVKKTLQYSSERCPKSTPVGHQKNGTRKPTGRAPPSKMQDRARKTSGKARNLRAKWKEISRTVEELGTLVKEEKSAWIKSCNETSKRETDNTVSEGMAEDANVDYGDKSRLRSLEATPQKTATKKDRHVNSWKKCSKTWTKHRSNLIGAEFVQRSRRVQYSWDREIGRPHNLSTKIWQMMQSSNTKSDNLECDFTEILEKTHQLEWNEAAKSIRVWAEKEEDGSPQGFLAAAGDVSS